ncbi:MAG: sterol desaturase [Gammaproteobacteria bacterium]|nr:sterol desaturase [Gammaproteobacteria bacterium]
MLTPTFRNHASYLLYPALLGGALLLWSSLWLGIGWDADVAMQLVYWAFLALLVILERLLPFEPAWNRNDGQLRNDIVLSILTIALNSIATIVCLWAIEWAISTIEPLVSLKVWPAHWPFYVQVIPGIILWDLGNHLAHRWAHKIPLLWRFHSVHHSAPRLSVINAGRFHPIDIVKSVVIGSPIPILLGVPAEIAECYAALYLFGGILTHANINLRCTFFSRFINTPDLHRWHHSPHPVETDTNYGEVTVVWDRLFGSYVFHARGSRRNLGLGYTVPVSRHLLEAIWHPLTPAGHHAGPESRIVSLPEGVTAVADIALTEFLAAGPPAHGSERVAGVVHGIQVKP